MRDLPGVVFIRHFISLFTEMRRETVAVALFDMILLLGSGCTTSTLLSPEPISTSKERPLCRTYQLLLAVGLAILRKIIYKTRID
jgi:hypothetical protein